MRALSTTLAWIVTVAIWLTATVAAGALVLTVSLGTLVLAAIEAMVPR